MSMWLLNITYKISCRITSIQLLNNINTRVVPKLVLTFFIRICNAIYRNSEKVHVFCSSLSFQKHLWTYVFQVDLELQQFCENRCAYLSGKSKMQEEIDKQMGGAFNVQIEAWEV